ncbi:macroglobulin / complement [Anaeramoeba flamelloides]|uniref:Macroglobulin / complement n=1 Tax=Anaeramoeba flamelloides TaxID=1746091 RepID=A0AAV8A636_9EUKA|nr:macroglobulin / complement [Anaeramoeba flamelloides]
MGNEQSTEEKFKNKPRYSVHISTDKETYKPGETLYCRAVVLDCFTHKPVPKTGFGGGYPICKITNSKEEEIFNQNLRNKIETSVLSFKWKIPESQNGGEYKIEIYFRNGCGVPKFERTFTIRKFTSKRFKTALNFKRKGYAAGENVKAQLKVERTEGGIPDQAIVTCTARLDEKKIYHKSNLKIDQDGILEIAFQLPEKILVGVGSLNCVITEGGSTETTSKTLPVVLKKMDLNLYPEGGQLINGIKCGVYVEARNLITGDPADFQAILIEKKIGKQNEIKKLLKTTKESEKEKEKETEKDKEMEKIVKGVEFETLHEGRGRFEFTPQENYEYYLKPIKPQGLDLIKLPESKANGVSIRLKTPEKENPFGEQISIIVGVNVPTNGVYTVGLFKKEEEIMSQDIEFTKGGFTDERDILLDPKKYDGVLRITIFEKMNTNLLPICERLVFVQPKSQLHFKIDTERKNYSPGDQVTITIKSLLKEIGVEKKEISHPSYVCVTVTDDSVYQMKEKRNRAPRLPEMYFLENEVQELKDPRAYLNLDLVNSVSADQEDRDIEQGKEIEPSMKIDLLLGTQGWRKFVYYKPRNKYNQLVKKSDKDRLQRLFNVEWQIYDGETDSEGGEESDESSSGLSFSDVDCSRSGSGSGSDSDSDSCSDSASSASDDKLKKEIPSMSDTNDEELDITKKETIMKKELDENEIKLMEDSDEDEDFSSDKEEKEQMKRPRKIESLEAVRVYAHEKRSNWNVEKRIDFTNTLYFSSLIEINPQINEQSKELGTSISFDLNDEVTSFRVFVDGFDSEGHLGCSQSFVFNSQKPFYIEPKLPTEITGGDQMMIPITIVNSLDRNLKQVLIKGTVQGSGLMIDQKNQTFKTQMEPEQRIGHVFTMKSQSCKKETNSITILGKSINPNLQDRIKRTLLVKPPGFPYEIRSSGILEENSETESFQLQMPQTIIKNTIKTNICVYPSPSSNITESLKALIRQPYGCFEQTSNTVYPMVMAIQYMKKQQKNVKLSEKDEEFMETAYKHLEKGYKKLVGYESSKGGFEWFGEDPAHEALTAMGIMEFSDMSKIWDQVDTKMLKRTTDWIFSRRDEENGGFLRNSRSLDSFGRAPKHTTDAYIVWALTKAGIGYSELERQFEKLETDSKTKYKDDSYYLAMAGLALFNVGFIDRSKYYAEQLIDFLDKKTGEVKRSMSSITNSQGSNLSVETTSVAMLLWLEHNMAENVIMTNKFIHSKNNNGRFGSTQATVLALMALIKYDEIMTKFEKEGQINLILNDKIIQTKEIVQGEKNAIYFDDISESLEKLLIEKKFESYLKIQMINGCTLPFSCFIESKVTKNLSDPEKCNIVFDSKLNVGKNNQIKEGEGTEIKVNLKNKLQEMGLGMVVAIIGLPAGLQPRYKKLLELKKTNVISHFELFGAREVVFYWRCMAPNQEIYFTFDVIAEFPGIYYGTSSRAYVYYDDENKFWNEPFNIEIIPKIKY